MNSQGLEALAALASAVPTSGTNPSTSDSNMQGTTNGGAGPLASVASNVSLSNSSSTLAAPGANNTSNLFQTGSGITQLQWQQAVATAAASMNAFAGNNNNNNRALLAGLQQLNQGNPSALAAMQQKLAMQQQLNYFRLLAQAQRQAGNQAAVHAHSASAASNSAASLDPTARAISLALSGLAQKSLPAMHGKCYISYLLPSLRPRSISTLPIVSFSGLLGAICSPSEIATVRFLVLCVASDWLIRVSSA
jgi:hypothetical protein